MKQCHDHNGIDKVSHELVQIKTLDTQQHHINRLQTRPEPYNGSYDPIRPTKESKQ